LALDYNFQELSGRINSYFI